MVYSLLLLNYTEESNEDNSNYFVIPLLYYSGGCRLEFKIATLEEVKSKACPNVDFTPQGKWINDTSYKGSKEFDSKKRGIIQNKVLSVKYISREEKIFVPCNDG